jgi:hypothetical protein
MAVNRVPGLSAGVATYLTVFAAIMAVVFCWVARRRRRARDGARREQLASSATVVQYIYTTAPVFVAAPGLSPPPPAHVPVYRPSVAADQVFLPGSVYGPHGVR